jgi:hypothetical protein
MKRLLAVFTALCIFSTADASAQQIIQHTRRGWTAGSRVRVTNIGPADMTIQVTKPDGSTYTTNVEHPRSSRSSSRSSSKARRKTPQVQSRAPGNGASTYRGGPLYVTNPYAR